MVEEPFVNLRTAIESTRQAVLLKYYNELLELDPKTQPKQITAVTRCVDTLERHRGEGEIPAKQRKIKTAAERCCRKITTLLPCCAL